MHPILTQPHTHTATNRPESLVIYPLDDLAVFEVTGADALSFVQGQITNDISNLGTEHARLAGYCTAQGRLLATMVFATLPETSDSGLLGFMRQDILAPVLKRLSMFVLRAKVKLAPSAYSVVGISSAATEAAALSQDLGHPLPQAPWQVVAAPTGLWICAPGSGQPTDGATCRWWWLASEAHLPGCQRLSVPHTLGTSAQWHGQDISAGLPWIEAAIQDLLIPQTLNLDLIEGVSFTKGCYPGQEIVARSHYRGTVKRRMHLGTIEQSPGLSLKAGADIFDAQGSEQACGRVINIAQPVSPASDDTNSASSAGTAYVLFETTFDALEHNALHLGARDGAPITLLSLPYTTKPA